MSDIGRLLVFAGVALVIVGALVLMLDRLPGVPFGKLPGDFTWERGDVKVYVPLATMIILSIVLTILVNVFWRLFR